MNGKYIIFEGMDLSGKTTTLNVLWEILNKRGIKALTTREPGGGEYGDAIRSILLNNKNLSIEEQIFLLQADRMSHYRTKIIPAIESGLWVLSDRSIISSLVYQQDNLKLLEETTKHLTTLQPDRIIYAKCGLEETLKRMSTRKSTEITEMDKLYTQHYELYSNRYDNCINKVSDITLNVNTNLSIEKIEEQLESFVDQLI